MSFELYLQRYQNGEPAGADVDLIRAMFRHVAADSEPDFWHVVYGPASDCNISLSRDENNGQLVDGLTIIRPIGEPKLWDSIFSVLKSGPWVLYYPDPDAPLIVADRAHADHAPSDMRETFETVKVVTSGKEIESAITG